ncbi:MAG: response regulator transcription factor [Elusimicrobia bacterium]|nr:response regulator transcription factor [Elusimicrobiota bacterium]
MSSRIFLVEDDAEMRRVTRVLLARNGYLVSEASSAEDALAEITRSLPDAAVIDVNLPGISGIKLVEILRGEPKTAALPILLLTALNKQGDKVQGFQRGADDYVTKPYDPAELAARLEALLRRSTRSTAPDQVLTCDELKIDLNRREVTVKGEPIALRKKEFELLTYFLKHSGQLLTRERISLALWGDDVIVTDNTISAHLKNLRSRLGVYGPRLETLIGEGYRFNDRKT